MGGKRKTSPLQRNVVYPLAMLLLLALTAITVLVVIQNTLELLIGVKALPLSTRVSAWCIFDCMSINFLYPCTNVLRTAL